MKYIVGDCRELLRTLPEKSAQCCVTSPPYYGLRDYGVAGQIGLEPTPDEYVAEMVAVFREVRRVLRDDGTLWLNIGDSYAAPSKGTGGATEKQATNAGSFFSARKFNMGDAKPKDLMGIPWLLAFALRADSWHLRSDIIWHKPNPMPESVRDRPTSAHEHVFLLSKAPRYFYDADAIRQPMVAASGARINSGDVKFDGNKGQGEHGAAARRASGNTWRPKGNAKTFRGGVYAQGAAFNNSEPMARNSHGNAPNESGLVNARNVWTIAPQPFKGAHFATMPLTLAERCISAGSRPGDTVLDPFGGAGTTGIAANRLGRQSVLIDLSPTYAAMAERRLLDDRIARMPKRARDLIG